MKAIYLLVLLVALTSQIFSLKMKNKKKDLPIFPDEDTREPPDFVIGDNIKFDNYIMCYILRIYELKLFNDIGKNLSECYDCEDVGENNCVKVIPYEKEDID